MLANLCTGSEWWYMEVPRTGTSTLERTLRHVFPEAKAIYAKHWPVLPPDDLLRASKSVVSVRNPYSRAVSCWQYFTVPGALTFVEWLQERKSENFFDIQIEARPQSFWLELCQDWDFLIRQEVLAEDFWGFVHSFVPDKKEFNLHRYNDINGNWVNRVRHKTSRTAPWQSYYTPEAVELVADIYASDFRYLSSVYESAFPGNMKSNDATLTPQEAAS